MKATVSSPNSYTFYSKWKVFLQMRGGTDAHSHHSPYSPIAMEVQGRAKRQQKVPKPERKSKLLYLQMACAYTWKILNTPSNSYKYRPACGNVDEPGGHRAPVGHGGKWRALHSAACTVEPGKGPHVVGGLVLLGAREPGRRDGGPHRADSATRQASPQDGTRVGSVSCGRHAVYSVPRERVSN